MNYHESSSSDDSYSDHSNSFTPPYDPLASPLPLHNQYLHLQRQQYLQQQQQQSQQPLFFAPHPFPLTTKASAALYALPSATAAPPSLPFAVQPIEQPPIASTTAVGMDDMDHWLVDICAELGTADDDAVAAANATATRCVVSASSFPPPSSAFRPVDPIPTTITAAAAASPASSSASSAGSSSYASSSIGSSSGKTKRPLRRIKKQVPAAAAATTAANASLLNSTVDAMDDDMDDSNSNSTNNRSQPLTAAEMRREKNRLRVRRHYYRKLTQMNDLRAQVQALEDKIEQLTLNPTQTQTPICYPQPLSELQLAVKQLDAAKRSLVAENHDVRAQLYAQTRHLTLVRQQQQQQFVLAAAASAACLVSSTRLGPLMPMPFIIKRHLVPSDCVRIWQTTTRELSGLVCHCAPAATFHSDLSTDSSSSECDSDASSMQLNASSTICGWRATRTLEHGAFKFVFQKMLRLDKSPIAALDAAWNVLKSPQGFANLYSPTVNMWVSLVQTVDANNVVLFQEHKSMDASNKHNVMKTILLATRICDTRTGSFSITLRGVGHDALELEDLSTAQWEGDNGNEVWNDINCWLQWIPRCDDEDEDDATGVTQHCEMKVSGAIPTVGSNAYYWMVEVLFIVMRLEAATSTRSVFCVR